MATDAAIAGNLADPTHIESMNGAAGTVAHGGAEHADPTALGLNATAWVALAMIVVIIIMLWKKVPGVVTSGLDKKIAAIRANLDEAAQLRAEAEAIKAEYEGKARAAAAEADDILAHARQEAETIVTQAKADASALIDRRGKMATDKIAAAERAAVAEVRARAAAAAAAAATTLIRSGHDAAADKALVDKTITGLGSTRLN